MTEPFAMDRRTVMARVLAVVGASLTPGLSVDALAKAAARQHPYLDQQVFNLLSSVADTIVPRTDTPGALDVRVPAMIDALLVNWASGERRYQLTQALSAIDRKSSQVHSRAFTALTASERHALLTEHDKQALRILPAKPGRGSAVELMAGPNHADPSYAKLKELIVLLYYMSEPALTEELSYMHAPGDWQPSIPVTAETRPMGGTLF